jgi:hypothetical protein
MKLKNNRNRVLVAVIGLAAVLLVTMGWSVMADIEPAPLCVPSGVYTGIHDPPLVYTFTKTIIPTDPAGNTATYIYRTDNGYPNMGATEPPLSEVDYMTDIVGNMVRTGPNTWAFTAICHGTKKVEGQPNPEMVYIAVFQGTSTYTEDGNTETNEGTIALYFPEQDVDGDGFPDEGQEPAFCGPVPPVPCTRLPVLSPCVLPPPEGE